MSETKKAPELEQLKRFAARAKVEAEEAAQAAAAGVTVPTKLSELTNDSGFQTAEQVTATVNAKVSSAYKAGGGVAFASLPAADAEHLGMVYNITDAFTTTASFMEGAGKDYPAGTNVVIVADGAGYKYDALAGFVDLSGYATSEALNTMTNALTGSMALKVDMVPGKGLSSNDYTDEDKAKLDGISFATDEEFNAMLDEVYGAAGA